MLFYRCEIVGCPKASSNSIQYIYAMIFSQEDIFINLVSVIVCSTVEVSSDEIVATLTYSTLKV